MVTSSGAKTNYPSGGPDLTLVLSRVGVVQSLLFCVIFCQPLCVFLFFFICWSQYYLSVDLNILYCQIYTIGLNTSYMNFSAVSYKHRSDRAHDG
jgi:hypothetical protein